MCPNGPVNETWKKQADETRSTRGESPLVAAGLEDNTETGPNAI